MKISTVVPCHNEQESLPVLLDALQETSAAMRASRPELEPLELVLIDDGSSDGTLPVMKEASSGEGAATHPDLHVRWASMSRGFGKEAAMLAGLSRSTGDLVATMDADMQDPPSLLPEMLSMLEADPELDSVATRRVSRAGEPPIRSAFARAFYRLMGALSDAEVVDGARDYRLMRRQMVDAVLSLPERNRFTKGIYGWVGFRTAWLEYENVERAAGESNWSFWGLFAYAIDGIVAFSTKPLVIASGLGALMCLLAIVALIFIVVRAAAFGDPVAGWPSLATLVLLVGGIQLLCLGVMGQYLAKAYLETKARPIYIIRSSSED